MLYQAISWNTDICYTVSGLNNAREMTSVKMYIV